MTTDELKPIEYEPTLANITLTKEQESLMVQAIKHICAAPSALKQTTRCQFWFKKIWNNSEKNLLQRKLDKAKEGLIDNLPRGWSESALKEIEEMK